MILASPAAVIVGVLVAADCSPRWHARLLIRQIRKDTRP